MADGAAEVRVASDGQALYDILCLEDVTDVCGAFHAHVLLRS
jgi:hypothetical protein